MPSDQMDSALGYSHFVWDRGGISETSEEISLLHKQVHRTATSKIVYRSSLRGMRVPSLTMRWIILLFVLVSFCVFPAYSQGLCSLSKVCHPTSDDLVVDHPDRHLHVSSTCGTDNDTTVYRKKSDTGDFTDYLCDEANPHPPDYMVDESVDQIWEYVFENPVLNTYWMSGLTVASPGDTPGQVTITLNLTDHFLIRSVLAVFVSPHILDEGVDSDMRPRAMAIEYMASPTTPWAGWGYFAQNCASSFPDVPVDTDTANLNATTPYCQEKYYSGDTSTYSNLGFGREQVKFNPSNLFSGSFSRDEDVQRHYMATAVRLRLVEPADVTPLSSYYGIADLDIDGQCACFGHAASCLGQNEALCDCEHYTTGDHCDTCLPLYNNKSWGMGTPVDPNVCEDCGCNGHAVSCHYDEEKGYGVCDDCQEETSGDKCEYCQRLYYINPEKDNMTQAEAQLMCQANAGVNSISYECGRWCIPCNCNIEGSTEESLASCDNSTGECECRNNVFGRECGECVDGYWNLDQANPDGCQECVCDSAGTTNITICDKATGQCLCKNNTDTQDCGQCKDGFFDLTLDNPEGCLSCDCDPGGSLDLVCPKVGGQCVCRPGIEGRTCKQPLQGMFVPSLDHILLEAEFSDNAADYELVERSGHREAGGTCSGRGFLQMLSQDSLQWTVTLPKTTLYRPLIRYESDGTWTAVTLGMSLATQQTGMYECAGVNITKGIRKQAQITILPGAPAAFEELEALCLLGNEEYIVTLTLASSIPTSSTILLDSVMLLPDLEETLVYKRATAEVKAELTTCYEAAKSLTDTLANSLNCTQYAYSIMAETYNGAEGCVCEASGSGSELCDPLSGQCPCFPGMMLLDCSQCMVDHYGYDSGEPGCTACDCDTMGSVRSACNDTGICECKTNITGINCDVCINENWGLFTGSGCVMCTCDLNYALNNSCEDSGQCHCKPGVGGLTCDSCLDGYYNLTDSGCTMCGCDADGSTGGLCDKEFGICTCKTMVQGEKCDECPTGTFGLGTWGEDGCLSCYCSGHSTNCSSATGWYEAQAGGDWGLLEGDTAVQEEWTGTDGKGQPVIAEPLTKITNFTAQTVIRIIDSGDNLLAPDLYFSATPAHLGNKRGAYGQSLYFSLGLTIPTQKENVTYVIYENRIDGDVVLVSTSTDYRLVTNLNIIPRSSRTAYTIHFHESAWFVDRVDGLEATYPQIIEVLGDLSGLYVRARFTNATGAYVDLYAAETWYASEDDSSGVPINNVESCHCPPEYMGQFCEQCASGFKRAVVNGGAYGVCVPCSCNSHQESLAACEPETGACNCTHNTTGLQCELCMPGFYGDATLGTTDDCSPCMCPGNVVDGDINVFASTCELLPGGRHRCLNCSPGHGGDECDYCLDQWYGVPTDPQNSGGVCSQCLCNGRAGTCNTTSGWCVSCSNNTAGKECDRCAAQYYGNAMLYDCQECGCDSIGATGDCDHTSGQCDCKPNVGGFDCSYCVSDEYYNYTSGEGCYPCDCHPVGSLDTSCHGETGQCTCRSHVIDRRCDLCEETYWRINYDTGCDPCSCTETGTAVIDGQTFGTCGLEDGQCECSRPGIIGSTCDHCAKGTKEEFIFVNGIYVGIYPECELCGECYDSWAQKIDILGGEILSRHNETITVWKHYNNLTLGDVEPMLEALQGNLTSVNTSIILATDMMNGLRYLDEGFTQIVAEAELLEVRADILDDRMLQLADKADDLQSFTGEVEVSDRVTTPQEQLDMTDDHESMQAQYFQEATASWRQIQNQTDLLRLTDSSVLALSERVRLALLDVDAAISTAATTETLLQEMLAAGSEEALDNLELMLDPAVQGSLSWQIKQLQGNLLSTEAVLIVAEQTTSELESTSQDKTAEVESHLVNAQSTKLNSSLAQQEALAVRTASYSFRDDGQQTLDKISSAMLAVVNSLLTVNNITDMMIQGETDTDRIKQVTLRPLSELETITAEIEQTDISQAEVLKTYGKAEQALQVAQEAVTVTAQAADISEEVLRQMQGIQAELAMTETLSLQAEQSLLDLNNDALSVSTISSQVEDKAENAMLVAGQTEDAVDNVLSFLNSINQCYQGMQLRTNTASSDATKARQTVSDTEQVVQESENRVGILTNSSGTQLADVSRANGSMAALTQATNQLMSDVTATRDATNLAALESEISSQASEMGAVQIEMSAMERDMDSLLKQLDLLPEDTAQCRYS